MKQLILALFPLALLSQQTYTVCSSGCSYTTLQSAVTQAAAYQNGTSCAPVHVVLTAGQTFTENVILPSKTCAQYVRIRSSKIQELPDGVRVLDTDASKMPKIIAPNNSINATIRTAGVSGTGYWALEGLEISSPASQSGSLFQFTTVGLPEDSTGEKQLSQTPHHIVIDRSWIHGVTDVEGPQRCIGAHGRNIEITNSRIDNCKFNSSGDSQGIFIQNGPGPFWVVNNYIEGGAENVLIGQGPGNSAIPWLTQRGIVFLGNYFYKRRSWKYSEGAGVPTWSPCLDGEKYRNTSGGQWYICNSNVWSTTANQSRVFVKNIFEFKEGQNSRIEGNVFDGNWRDGQTGTNFLINQGDAVHMNVRGVALRSNKWRYGQAFWGTGYFGTSDRIWTGDITVENNLQEDIGTALYGYAGANSGSNVFMYGWRLRMRNITLRHNTITAPSGQNLNNLTKSDSGSASVPGPVNISDNAFSPSSFTWNRDGYPSNGWCSWRDSIQLLGDLRLANNLIAGGSTSTGDSPGCPAYVDFPTSTVFGTNFTTTFTDPANRDWTMKTAGPGKGTASDGTDVGADFTVLNAATATVQNGTWPNYLLSGFRTVKPASTSVTIAYTAPSTTTCTLAASTSKAFGVTAGTPSTSQTGRSGTGSVTGLTTNTGYWLRLSCGSDRFYEFTIVR